jgi:hypothetical protein
LFGFKAPGAAGRYRGAMNALLLAVPALSLLVLAAHFFRDGAWILSGACVALVVLLAWRRPWAIRLLQAALALGTIEWAWTAFVLVQQRIAEGRPWGRLALILGVVSLLTAASVALVGRRAKPGV